MPNDFVHVNGSSKFGRELVQLADLLRNCRDRAEAVKQRMDHLRLDNGTNSAPICNPFGLTPEDHATGAGAYTVVSNALAALSDPAITTLIERVG